MSAKKKKLVNMDFIFKNDETLISLKERYFKIIRNEDYPKTPQITKTLDTIEQTISKRKEDLINEHS
jgi:hypothetical protein